MGESTKIEWTDHTFNPWWGCSKVSDACKHCYAESFAKRTGHEIWGDASPRRFFSDAHWEEPRKWDRDAARDGVRRKVFCASMADVFEERPDLVEPRARLIRLIEDCDHLDWLLLTKRPELAVRLASSAGWSLGDWPEQAWIGTTVESPKEARRAYVLKDVPTKYRFLSCEPLLSGLVAMGPFGSLGLPPHIDWIIGGGESGPGARPMHPSWVRELRDAVVKDRRAFFFKQWGDWEPMMYADAWADGLLEMGPSEWKSMLSGTVVLGYDGTLTTPERPYERWLQDLQKKMADEHEELSEEQWSVAMHRVGKMVAGRVLDGRTWGEYPDGSFGSHVFEEQLLPAADGRAERRRQKCKLCDLSISVYAMTSGRCQPRALPTPRQLEILS